MAHNSTHDIATYHEGNTSFLIHRAPETFMPHHNMPVHNTDNSLTVFHEQSSSECGYGEGLGQVTP